MAKKRRNGRRRRLISRNARHRELVNRIVVDYGFDPNSADAMAVLDSMPDMALESMTNPTYQMVRDVFTTCSQCGEYHPELEPLDRPEYQAALEAAKDRDAMMIERRMSPMSNMLE